MSVGARLHIASVLAAVGFTAGVATAWAPTITAMTTRAHTETAAPSPVPTVVTPPASVQSSPSEAPTVQWTATPARVTSTQTMPRVGEAAAPAPTAPPPAPMPPRRAERPVGPAATAASAAPPTPAPAPELVLNRLEVASAGAFQAGGRLFHLADVDVPGADDTCRDARGRVWPCGRRALAAMQAMVRQRTVHCAEAGPAEETTPVRCRVGRTDLAAWLVEQGWARPKADDGRLGTLHASARAARVGQFATEVDRP